jgi:hypothetical protein
MSLAALHRIALRSPLVAFWLLSLARIEPTPELLSAAMRLFREECGEA